jgi:hypothetical protein
VLLFVIVLIFMALHHICIARVTMNHLVNQAMETGLVVGWLVVMLNQV